MSSFPLLVPVSIHVSGHQMLYKITCVKIGKSGVLCSSKIVVATSSAGNLLVLAFSAAKTKLIVVARM